MRRHLQSFDADLFFWPLAALIVAIIAAVVVLVAVAS